MGKGKLIPYSPTLETTRAGFELLGESRVEADSLRLFFRLSVSDSEFLKGLLPPVQNINPLRLDELWKATCFEAFISKPHTEGYFEFNGTLNGEWNLYEFDSYRTGMRPVPLIANLQPALVRREIDEKEWMLEYQVPLSLLGASGPQGVSKKIGPLSMTAVLKRGEDVTYWAFKHAGAKPDFHLRESFCDDPIRN